MIRILPWMDWKIITRRTMITSQTFNHLSRNHRYHKYHKLSQIIITRRAICPNTSVHPNESKYCQPSSDFHFFFHGQVTVLDTHIKICKKYLPPKVNPILVLTGLCRMSLKCHNFNMFVQAPFRKAGFCLSQQGL